MPRKPKECRPGVISRLDTPRTTLVFRLTPEVRAISLPPVGMLEADANLSPAFHGDDILYVFGLRPKATAEYATVIDQYMTYW